MHQETAESAQVLQVSRHSEPNSPARRCICFPLALLPRSTVCAFPQLSAWRNQSHPLPLRLAARSVSAPRKLQFRCSLPSTNDGRIEVLELIEIRSLQIM